MSINYAPEVTGIAPYSTAFAEHRARAGGTVLALTGIPHYPHWSLHRDDRFMWQRTEWSGELHVRRLRHYVPSRQSAIRRGMYEASYGSQVLAQRLPWTPDVVLAVVPSILGALAAARLARRYNAPFGVWVQDLMGQAATQSGISGGQRVAEVARHLEGVLLRGADGVAVISESHSQYVQSLGVEPSKVSLTPNWTHTSGQVTLPAEEARKKWNLPTDRPVALHSGNMGLKQGLESVVEAARQAERKRSPVHFVLAGDGSQRAVLEQLGGGCRNLSFIEPVDADDYAALLSTADVFLLTERMGGDDMSLPSKLTSYLQAARPIVAAVAEAGSTAREVRRSGGGLVVSSGDPVALLGTVERLCADADLRSELATRGTAYAELNLASATGLSRLDGFLVSVLQEGNRRSFEAAGAST